MSIADKKTNAQETQARRAFSVHDTADMAEKRTIRGCIHETESLSCSLFVLNSSQPPKGGAGHGYS